MKNITKFFENINKFYLFNILMISLLIMTIMLKFMVQFKVESIQEYLKTGRNQISSYHDEIAMLDVQWTYLTRPSRVRNLANQFLTNIGYSQAEQIKNEEKMQKIYALNYEKKLLEEQKYIASNF